MPIASPSQDEHDRWTLTKARDNGADSIFVYAVTTTRIYCRPSCPSRLARRANVIFFDDAKAADEAGFRACKRCRPQLDSFTPDAQMVQSVCEMLDRNSSLLEAPSLEQMAETANLTPSHFHRKFRRTTGQTPRTFAASYRRRTEASERDGQSDADSEYASSGVPSAGVTPLATILPSSTDEDSMAQGGLQCWPNQASVEDPVYFKAMSTDFGLLAVAFQEGQICHLQLCTTFAEMDEALTTAFPAARYRLLRLDEAPHRSNTVSENFIDDLVQAVECPSGKILNLPLSRHLRSEYYACDRG